MIKEHDRIVLTSDIPGEGLKAGDVGTVVHVYAQGEVFEVELKTIGETYVYEFKVLTSDGRISDVSVDAASGRIIKSESE